MPYTLLQDIHSEEYAEMIDTSMKQRETTSWFKIHCHQCRSAYQSAKKENCKKCGSKFCEATKLERKTAQVISTNHRQALWINALGRIQAPPKKETQTLSNENLVKSRSRKAEAESECSICMDTIKIGDSETKLENCVHKFHEKCIKIWVKTAKNTCPNCNQIAFES